MRTLFLFCTLVFFSLGVLAQTLPSQSRQIGVRYLSPEEVGDKSKLLVHVRIESIFSEQKNGMVYTVVKCSVVDSMGSSIEGGKLEVRQPGGSVGNISTWSGPMPGWKEGEEWVFGLSAPLKDVWTVVGIKQGAFRVDGEHAERNYDGLLFVEPPPDSVVERNERFLLSELKSRLVAIADAKSSPVDTSAEPHDEPAEATQYKPALFEEAPKSERAAGDKKAINRLPLPLLVVLLLVIVTVLLLLGLKR